MEPKNVNKQFGFAEKYCPAGGQQPKTVGVRKLFCPRSQPGIHSQIFLFLLEVVAESRRRVSEDTTHWVMEEPVSMATEQGVILTVKQETQETWMILWNSGFRCQTEVIDHKRWLSFDIEASGKSRNWERCRVNKEKTSWGHVTPARGPGESEWQHAGIILPLRPEKSGSAPLWIELMRAALGHSAAAFRPKLEDFVLWSNSSMPTHSDAPHLPSALFSHFVVKPLSVRPLLDLAVFAWSVRARAC